MLPLQIILSEFGHQKYSNHLSPKDKIRFHSGANLGQCVSESVRSVREIYNLCSAET